jgi:hypothetical protein
VAPSSVMTADRLRFYKIKAFQVYGVRAGTLPGTAFRALCAPRCGAGIIEATEAPDPGCPGG